MKKIFYKLLTFLGFRKKQPEHPEYYADAEEYSNEKFSFVLLEDLPEEPRKNIIYLIGDDGGHWMIGFVCPCGCLEFIQLNTLPDSFPSWSYKIDNGVITISPSIRRKRGCYSHFFIQKSKVVWTSELYS